MSRSQGKYLLPNRKFKAAGHNAGMICLIILLIGNFKNINSQVINYVTNGSFEDVLTNSSTPTFYSAKFWGGIDSSKYYGEVLSKIASPVKAPLSSYTYQEPRHGNSHIITTFYSNGKNNNRGYPRNRLKKNLDAGKTYCFTMYVNLSNNSVNAIDAIGVYFGDASIDTISQCNKPITYLTPQVQNSTNNIISDTLNWILIQGQFTANGTEKYALIGNFMTDANTNTVLANPTHSPAITSEYLLDQISLIELNLPAFAGRDTFCFAGDSVFIGREPDVGIDEACVWYKLPQTTPIDTVAGFWVKPTATSTYVVRQEICGLVKWDTVRVFMDAVGSPELNAGNFGPIKLFPNPARNMLNISGLGKSGNVKVSIEDMSGRLVLQQDQVIVDGAVKLFIDLIDGAYIISIETAGEQVRKKLLIAR